MADDLYRNGQGRLVRSIDPGYAITDKPRVDRTLRAARTATAKQDRWLKKRLGGRMIPRRIRKLFGGLS
ncbi:MAG: hypothetical protein QNJ92_06775 [Alphaproteobacteria bacterium]|nr:hypothetical protein [Alphaproteobacteria bacterium]